MVFDVPGFDPEGVGGKAAMFFAGLILLIPHRIGMSRVNYVIKRYNLPISRAGLLLYKYHNNIELSLTIGTLIGNIIVWTIGSINDSAYNSITLSSPNPSSKVDTPPKKKNYLISIFMTIFLILMLLSSIIMYIIYISGGDFGHLNSFYFSLIFLTLFDGFANAFAFGCNGKNASMLAAGIPLSGFLVTLLHYIYKFYSDKYLWDDFDYYVLRLQLLLNILQIFVACGLWLCFQVGPIPPSFKIEELFGSGKDHRLDFVPICMLAISLGTVYAFYPSIAPYSIIDFQYASVVELWILVISAIIPFTFAILDMEFAGGYGPSGKYDDPSAQSGVNIGTSDQTIPGDKIEIQHDQADTGNQNHIHGACKGLGPNASTQWHDYATVNYTINNADDKYWDPYNTTTNKEEVIPSTSSADKSVKFKAYQNWFNSRSANIIASGGSVSISDSPNNRFWWCVWFCAIFYILCIQIFMSMLHYPHSSLSSFFNNHPLRIGFISVLFNTLRELMQACGFAGAGKQISSNNESVFEDYEITSISTTAAPSATGHVRLNLNLSASVQKAVGSGNVSIIALQPINNPTIKVWKKYTLDSGTNLVMEEKYVNGSIAATNKLITLFVMMFCVFTGDGYLQHYRRCCRDNWPTTGYNKYQSFFYWLRFGFKGGIKSITSSFTDLYYHNLRPQFISYA